ncbi:MAG: hypothetical protein H0U90_10815 [Actinobacteria bacterium]|nr:hypothetical protein [Actinomycetota bacterium]
MATKAATAWGDATVVDEVTLPQHAGEREFASLVQLLAGADGSRYVRFAYTTDGKARRGPVTLRAEDINRLGESLVGHSELAAALSPALPAGRRTGGGR